MLVTIVGMIWALVAVMITETPWLIRIATAAATILVLGLLFSISPADKTGFLSAVEISTRRGES